MKRVFTFVAALLFSLVAIETCANAKEQWTRVQSANFTFVGNASERDIREIAVKLEQYRNFLARLFDRAHVSQTVPTTILVFKNDATFKPFRPIYRGRVTYVDGYFQPGREVNYLAVSAERMGEQVFGTVFHEFTHLFIDENLRGLPLCINEGLAEYFSSVRISEDGSRITLGRVNAQRVSLLSRKKLLPLETLLTTDYESDYYNLGEQRPVFYAQSWALVHYLINLRDDSGLGLFEHLLISLARGVSINDGLKQAFGSSVIEIEKDLKSYLRNYPYPTRVIEHDQQLTLTTETRTSQISSADADAYVGDLLLHLNRLDESETYLQKSLSVNPDQLMAQASLGMLRVKQERPKEAVQILRSAAAADSQNPITQYYFAYAISREGMQLNEKVPGYESAADELRAALIRAVRVSPNFIEAYRLYAFASLVLNENLEMAEVMLRTALRISPDRQDLNFLLAQIHLRGLNFKSARNDLEPIIQRTWDTRLRDQASKLIEEIAIAEGGEDTDRRIEKNTSQQSATSDSLNQHQNYTVRPKLVKRFKGERVSGLLTNIQCLDNGVVLSVKVADREWRLFAPELRSVYFVTYVAGLERTVNCGARASRNLVVLTYNPITEPRDKYDGNAIAIEFVPEDIDIEP
jgi:tetratricopeptide (TPR) repeat protein